MTSGQRFMARLRAIIAAAARVNSDMRELAERRALLNGPWQEDYLHWAHDGQRWRLHGYLSPPAGRRIRAVTSRGWCLGLAQRRGAEDSLPVR